eukprot:3675679-Rhodomonas_salina.4
MLGTLDSRLCTDVVEVLRASGWISWERAEEESARGDRRNRGSDGNGMSDRGSLVDQRIRCRWDPERMRG